MRKLLLLALPLFLMAAGCSQNNSVLDHQGHRNTFSESDFFTDDFGLLSSRVQVVDLSGNPIANAKVLVGFALNDPFENNYFTTDEDGIAAIPSAWNQALPVTVESNGFLRSTHLSVLPGERQITLAQDSGFEPFEVKGTVDGFGPLPTDKNLDFGMVTRLLSRDEILSFDLNELISPYSDKVTVLGQSLNVPSNLSIPQQKVKYSILTVNFNKPVYRSFTRKTGVQRYYVAQGDFHLQRVGDALRSGSDIFSVVNELNLSSGSFGETVVGPGGASLNLTVKQFPLNLTRTVKAPDFGVGNYMISVLLEKDKGLFYPTAARSFAPSESQSFTHSGKTNDQLFVSLMGKAAQGQNTQVSHEVSVAITPDHNVEFLPIVSAPKWTEASLLLEPPQSKTLNSAGVYAVMEDYKTIESGNGPVTLITKRWEVFADNWVSEIELPQMPTSVVMQNRARWAVNFLGSKNQKTGRTSHSTLSEATHLSRNVTELR